MVALSVVLPTYNGAERFPRVLECLRLQANTECFQWEVIVVDNNSSDNTKDIFQKQIGLWPSSSWPLRYVFEPRQGLAYARQAGVETAKGDWVAFLDDDNWPDIYWVSEILAFVQAHPKAGAIGSQITGNFEQPPVAVIKPLLFYLAINERGETPMLYDPRSKGVPPGAGLAVRRDAWLKSVPSQLFLVGRVNNSCLPGEDAEALLYLHRSGWEIWYNPAMKIEHHIPAFRIAPNYLKSNLFGIGLCRHHLRMLMFPVWQRPLMATAYICHDFYKIIVHWLHHTQRPYSLLAECEMKRLLGTFAGPFYLTWLRLQRFIQQTG